MKHQRRTSFIVELCRPRKIQGTTSGNLLLQSISEKIPLKISLKHFLLALLIAKLAEGKTILLSMMLNGHGSRAWNVGVAIANKYIEKSLLFS